MCQLEHHYCIHQTKIGHLCTSRMATPYQPKDFPSQLKNIQRTNLNNYNEYKTITKDKDYMRRILKFICIVLYNQIRQKSFINTTTKHQKFSKPSSYCPPDLVGLIIQLNPDNWNHQGTEEFVPVIRVNGVFVNLTKSHWTKESVRIKGFSSYRGTSFPCLTVYVSNFIDTVIYTL